MQNASATIDGGAVLCVVAPALAPIQPFSPLDHLDVVSATVEMIQRLSEAKRNGDRDALDDATEWFERIPALRQTVHQVANGRTFSEIQGDRGARRNRKIRQRNREMADEYEMRRAAYAARGEHINFGDLATQVGRLPRFKLRRSAAIEAVKSGLSLVRPPGQTEQTL